MAAPSGTVWGSAVGSGWVQSRLGIYKSVSTTATTATVTVQIWYWSKSSVTDQYNDLYYSCSSSTLSYSNLTNRGNVSVVTTNYDNGGSGWATSNQIKLKTYTYTYTRKTTAIKRYLYAKLDTVEYAGGTPKVSTTFTVPALASYTVKYNANGGSGAPSSQTKYYGKTLTLRTGVPTRTGYNFKGWSTSSTATSATYSAGGSYTANASATLYAVWAKKTYTIKYDADEGTGAPSNQTKTYGVTLTLSSTVPTKDGYTFGGWKDSLGNTYKAGGSYTRNAGDTLVAIWTPLGAYSISYDANGVEATVPVPAIKYSGVAYVLSSITPEAYGYTFSHWNTKSDGTGTNYNPNGNYTANADATFYAIWTPWSHTVKYNTNGGSSAPSGFTSTVGVESCVSTTVPTKNSYVFRYWCTSKDGNGMTFLAGDEYTNIQNGGTVTLYAIWGRNGVVFTNRSNCEATEFIETDELIGIDNKGNVYAKEYIEGSVIQLGENNFKFNEIIEI